MPGEFYPPVFFEDPWKMIEEAQTSTGNTGAPIDLMLTKTPDAQYSSPPPIQGLLMTPWVNSVPISSGSNAIPSDASPPTSPQVAADSPGSNGGDSLDFSQLSDEPPVEQKAGLPWIAGAVVFALFMLLKGRR